MIQHPAFPVEPWVLRETTLHPEMLAQTESLFALANGHIGWRGKSSNISGQAAARTRAVWVRTPSRSNRQPRPLSGIPSTVQAYDHGTSRSP